MKKLIDIQIPKTIPYYIYKNGFLLGKTDIKGGNYDIIICAQKK